MGTNDIDSYKLNEALDRFGSLQKANAQLESDKLVLEKKNIQLKQENDRLSGSRDELARTVHDMSITFDSYQDQLKSLANQIKSRSFQYELFCSFMAMVAESPSVTNSIDTLIALFQTLKDPGWYLPKNADEMRSYFIRIVIGDYLKCFRCKVCGVKFMVNKEPHYKSVAHYYLCPSCYATYGVEPDDSFLKAMVSEKQVENITHTEQVVKENEMLGSFKAFFNVPCEMCHELVKDWDDQNVKLAIEGYGYGHTRCWNSDLGQMRQLVKFLAKEKKT